MTIIQTLLFLSVLVVNLYLCAGSGGDCRESERMALLDFKAELIDDDGRLSSWGFSINCCEWKGVVCDNRTNHVVALDLHADFNFNSTHYYAAPLRGMISTSLLQLPHLQYLDLSFIDFYGTTLPSFIGSLSKLQHLSLRDSSFHGPIPHQIGNLSALRHLDLNYNYFYGNTNLDWLSGSPALEYLDLSSANLEGCTTWLEVIYKLPALKELLLSDCHLRPSIVPISVPSRNSSESLVILHLSLNHLDSSVFQKFLNMSSSFTNIDFYYNNLEGRIPNSLWNLKSLFYLHLGSNNLESSVPDAMGNLTSLSYLVLSRNQLQGEFPLRSQNSSSLTYLDLSGNSLNGQVSRLLTWLQDPVKLEYIYLSDNLFSGSFLNISRLSALKEMNLRSNVLNGAVLEGSVRLPNLEHLDLSSNKFTGIFPGNLWLPNLEYLDLSSNKFTGIFPGNLWLPNLEYLDLSSNKFTGRLPNMSSCVSLRVLQLFDNTFNGSLIQNIGHLPKMALLNANHNSLEEVITEAHLSSLPRLTDLYLSFNFNITVTISSHWKHRVQFQCRTLAYCKLGPGFPKWLQNQDQLEYLDISNSGILDTIPTWFWSKMHVCRDLNMSHSQIYGVLPDLSSKLKQLNTIDLSSNEFTGSLPRLPLNLVTIDMSRNKFSGTIPNFCKTFHYSIDLSNNQLSGEIPQDCFNSDYLNLANNNLSGKILTTNNFSCGVSSLHLRNNSFRGEIPKSLMNCSGLIVLDLGENEFDRKIPSWLGASMPDLKVLILKSNMFYGSLPSTICHLANIQVLDISSNKITGTIPNCVTNFSAMSLLDSFNYYFRYGNISASESASIIWKRNEATFFKTLGLLKMIDLSGNELTGVIPQEITSLIGLLGLNLSGNNLAGLIPQHIDQMELLNFLDLSRNHLSGGIPPTLSKLSHLGVLDLSFNNLSGRIPWETHMQTFGASAYLGNPQLCGLPLLLRPCPEDVKPTNGSDDSDKFINRGFYISMLLGFVLAFWVAFWVLFFQKWWSVFVMKAYVGVEDWLYVHILVNKRRLMRFFGKD